MEKRIFTSEEKAYIIKHWGQESAHSMKKKFNCSWYAVCSVAAEAGLPMPESNEWTKEDIKTLIELSENFHYKDIATLMHRSSNAIYIKARRLKITLIQDGRKWTEGEEETLEDLWGKIPIEQIAKKLKRTVFSLKVKAVRMSLGPMIQNNTDVMTVAEISDLLNVSQDRIRNTWVTLGLNLQKKQLTNNMAYYVVTWEDLLTFLEANQTEWDSREIAKNMLGEESKWLTEKRKRDRIENPLWYRKWTDEEIKQVGVLFQEGKDNQEIAGIVNRSEGAVLSVLRNLGYKSPVFWSEEELSYLKENYKEKTYEEIAIEIGRTEKAVGAKAEELGYQKRLIRSRKKKEI